MPLFGPSFFESVRDQKLSQRQAALSKASEKLSSIPIHPQEDVILATPAWQLAEKIKSKEWTSLIVVAAFSRRCIQAQNDLNCLTEGFMRIHRN
jgi:hypothetical protein